MFYKTRIILISFCIFLVYSFISQIFASDLTAYISAGRDSCLTLKFQKELNVATISTEDLQVTRMFIQNSKLIKEDLRFISSNVQEDCVQFKFPRLLTNHGVIRIQKKSIWWKYKDSRTIENFSILVDNRTHLIEDWSKIKSRRWVGANLWANRLQDWQVLNGQLECTVRDGNFPVRTVHAITREIVGSDGEFVLSVKVNGNVQQLREGRCFIGFIIAAGNGLLDYRARALVQSYSGLGGGILCVLDYVNERFTFCDNNDENNVDLYPELRNITWVKGEKSIPSVKRDIILQLHIEKTETDTYHITLAGWDAEDGVFLGASQVIIHSFTEIVGSFGLVVHPGGNGLLQPVRFSDFSADGSMLVTHPEREFGPIVGSLYSLDRNVLKISVQFMPVDLPGEGNDRFPLPLLAVLEYRIDGDSTWTGGKKVRITQPEYLAHFRVENWDDTKSFDYRVVFTDKQKNVHYYTGKVRKNPAEKEKICFAALTGMGVMGRRADARVAGEGADEVEGNLTGRWTPANVWFPHREIVSNIAKQDPDLIFFTGDQIYENNPTRPDRRDHCPVFDYLYKWYLWYWAFRDLTKDRPCILQVDDHDVYAGNVWGNSGDLNLTGLNSDGGGYMMDPLFVRLVERTQCLHDPDPYPIKNPLKNSFGSYFGSFTYGGISFAFLEDRKFKTRDLDEQGNGILLGEDQLRFLQEWAKDWKDAVVKVAVSQSTYASTHTEWDGTLAKDFDTGGYPKDGRDRALRALRKSRAFIICGDQHLATIIRMGVEQPGDATWQFCVPAAGNIYWRWFYPKKYLSLLDNSNFSELPDVSGDYVDAFGNHFRMIAVANPDDPKVMRLGRSRALIPRTQDLTHKRVSQGDGYGLVTIDKRERKILLECFPFDADLSQGGRVQFSGWPYSISFNQLEGRQPIGYLPDLNFNGIDQPVIEVIHEPEKETIYITRALESSFRPVVFAEGKYTIRIYDPKSPRIMKIYKGIRPIKNAGEKKVIVSF